MQLGNVLPSLQTLLLFSAILLILASYGQRRRQDPNYPPGPPQMPIFGNIFQIDSKNPHISIQEVRSLLGTPMIVVTGLPLIKEVLVNQGHLFVDRPRAPSQSYIFKINGKKKPGSQCHCLFASNGQEWKDQRRFTLMTLRNFGLGKKTLELQIQKELCIGGGECGGKNC
uniref:Uncharacterized protein n=1 Tax=Monodelphis domestica TaxID=13616 RepID=A0A5F8G3U1_MONDO